MFEIAALVDGRAVATESDVITVTGGGVIAGAAQVQQLVRPPDSGNHVAADAAVHPRLRPHVVYQPAGQHLVFRRRLLQHLPGQDRLSGRASREVKP